MLHYECQNVPLPIADLDRHLIRDYFSLPDTPFRLLERFIRFYTASATFSVYATLQHPFSPKHLGGRSGPPSNTPFLWLTRPTTPNGISIQSGISFFPKFTVDTKGQTDRQTEEQTNRIRRNLSCTNRPLTQYLLRGLKRWLSELYWCVTLHYIILRTIYSGL